MPPVIGVSKKRQASAMPSIDFDELRHDLGPLRIAEVQIVGGGDRQRAHRRQIAAAFGDHQLRAFARIEVAVAAVAVERHRDRGAGLLDAHDRRVGARARRACWCGPGNRTAPRSSAWSRDRRRRAALADRACRSRLANCRSIAGARCAAASCAAGRRAALRRPARGSESRRRPRRDSCTRSMPSSVTTPISTASRPHFLNTRKTSSSRPLLGDQQHALLRFGEHDLVGRHAGFALRNAVADRSRCRSPPRLPISQVEQVRPAAPMS